jgi:stage V sporulation protein AE
MIGQILIDKTKLTPARILVLFVTAGVVLTGLGLYEPLVKFAGAGATVPLTGFGYALGIGVIKEVNQIGRSLTTDLQKTISAGSPFDIDGSSSRFVTKDSWGGRLCVGQYSYIWNYGSAIFAGDVSHIYLYEDSNTDFPRFVKVIDPNASYYLDGNAQYTRITYPDNAEIERIQENTDMIVKGWIGKNKDTKARVIIETKYGGVTITQ